MEKYTIQEYFAFIAEYEPRFSKNGKIFEMFSVPTQHIKSEVFVELLNKGIECVKNQNGKSPIRYYLEDVFPNQMLKD